VQPTSCCACVWHVCVYSSIMCSFLSCTYIHIMKVNTCMYGICIYIYIHTYIHTYIYIYTVCTSRRHVSVNREASRPLCESITQLDAHAWVNSSACSINKKEVCAGSANGISLRIRLFVHVNTHSLTHTHTILASSNKKERCVRLVFNVKIFIDAATTCWLLHMHVRAQEKTLMGTFCISD
jgi:hypothetical protein